MGFDVGGVPHHMYSSVAGRNDFKAGRRLEKQEPCSAPAGPRGPYGALWTPSQGWGLKPEDTGKVKQKSNLGPVLRFQPGKSRIFPGAEIFQVVSKNSCNLWNGLAMPHPHPVAGLGHVEVLCVGVRKESPGYRQRTWKCTAGNLTEKSQWQHLNSNSQHKACS